MILLRNIPITLNQDTSLVSNVATHLKSIYPERGWAGRALVVRGEGSEGRTYECGHAVERRLGAWLLALEAAVRGGNGSGGEGGGRVRDERTVEKGEGGGGVAQQEAGEEAGCSGRDTLVMWWVWELSGPEASGPEEAAAAVTGRCP